MGLLCFLFFSLFSFPGAFCWFVPFPGPFRLFLVQGREPRRVPRRWIRDPDGLWDGLLSKAGCGVFAI